ncbi:MAG: endo-1,4-beta-xylanase, partial [Chloroflexota bacterium]
MHHTHHHPLRWGHKLFVVSVLLTFLLAMGLAPASAAPQAAPTGERLRDLAGSFLIGYASINNFWNISDAAQYQEVARTEFNIMTPENHMKFDAIHPSQNTYNFPPADQHVQFAQANNMKVHGHTLVWHSQLPSWVSNGSWNEASLTSVMYDHIDTVMNHYDGQIYVWDVVNEAFNEDGSYRTSIWYNTIGQKYIELAFRRARAADPTTKLIYNDYNIETVNSKSTGAYNMIADFKARGVPIDGIGFQMHLAGGMDYQSFASNMQRFANLGLEIYITEMDVRYPTPISQANLTAQATVYRNVIDRCLAQPACKALQVWGIPDKYSWVPDVFPGQGDALIFDNNYQAKPAYYALQAALGGTTVTPTTVTPTSVTPTTATPTNPGTGGCQVAYTANSWNSGFTAEIKITNNGASPIQGWTLAYSYANGQQVTSAWNATVTQSGANVTASNPTSHWNGNIPANGGSVSFGVQGTHSGTNTNPTTFVLNGVTCNGGG